MAASRSDSIRKAQIPSVCHLCEESKPLKWKCIDCDLLLCNTCKVKVHSKFKSADEHDVINLKDIGKGYAGGSDIPSIGCNAHPGQDICLYCINCNVVACKNCVSESHSKHHLESFGKTLKDKIRKLIHIKQVKEELQEALSKLINDEQKINEKITTDKRRYETAKEDASQHIAEIKRVADEEGDKMLKCLERNWIETETTDLVKKSNISRIKEDIRSEISAAERALERNDTEAIIRRENDLSSIFECVQMIEKEYVPGKVDLRYMIGKIQNKEMEFEILNSHKLNFSNITNVHPCKDGHVYLIDEFYKYTLQKILVNKSDFKVIKTIKDIRVYDIIDNDNGDVILSFVGETYLKCIKSNGVMQDYLEFAPWRPRALHLTRTGDLLIGGLESGEVFDVTKSSERKIIVQNKDGTILHEYQFDFQNKRLFNLVIRIRTLRNNDIIVIDRYNDKKEGGIISICYPNIKKWVYRGDFEKTSKHSFFPNAIETTDTGNIIVNDKFNYLFHILNMNGSIISLVNSRRLGIGVSLSLGIDNSGQLLVFGREKQEDIFALLNVVSFSGF